MEQIDIGEAKTRLLELVNAAALGQEFILAKNGRLLAMLVPSRQPRKKRYGRGVVSTVI